MGLTEELLERASAPTVLGVGLGALFLAPVLVPAVGRGLRPVVKGAIKGYLTVADRSRELLAEAGERMQDLYAEAQAERAGGDADESPDGPSSARRRSPRRASRGSAQPDPA
jgi:hypothetical protein